MFNPYFSPDIANCRQPCISPYRDGCSTKERGHRGDPVRYKHPQALLRLVPIPFSPRIQKFDVDTHRVCHQLTMLVPVDVHYLFPDQGR